jgi:hypothetical protein
VPQTLALRTAAMRPSGWLEIEAMVQNRDIAFLHAGQSAEIKNFTK